MAPRPRDENNYDRRGFLGIAGGGALLCNIGTPLDKATERDVVRSDRSASRLRRPEAARQQPDPADAPQPQPGGVVREYWIAARSLRWDVAPSGQDEWMRTKVRAPRTFRALVYQRYSANFAQPVGPAEMPGPTLEAEVGDTIVVHFRNADEKFAQPLAVHPHGVRARSEYSGAYLGEYTPAGGFVAPGEDFTYVWECPPDSVGAWPYHDGGPNQTLNQLRGLFGAIIVRPKGAPRPDVEEVLFLGSLPPNVTRLRRLFQTINGRAYAGNTPTLHGRPGQRVTWHIFGGDAMFHTFHVHAHRWGDSAGVSVDNPGFGPNERVTASWIEDNPGRWLYHCHVFSHQNAGMAGWYIVE